MKRIIIHWTAGTYSPNPCDYEHYHFLINGDGLVLHGNYEPKDNLNCKDGKYAAHTEMGNTGSIGVAFCGMRNFKSQEDHGLFPLRAKQCEAGFKFIAELCIKYKIKITPQTVLTHYEFDCNRGKEGRKIDIICLPYTYLPKKEIGNYIRKRISYYYALL